MPRALVLGGEGMLGRAVVSEARRRGYPALGLSHAVGDVTRPELLEHWMRSFRPEVVVNCAAYTQVDRCEEEREEAFAVNDRGVEHAAAAAGAGRARLIHVSTDYVFDGAGSRPYREEDATAPLSVYGESKLAGEARALAAEDTLVVRASWLFGPGGACFPATILGLLARGEQRLRVVDDQEGCPTYTPYLAAALWDLEAAGARGIVHYRNRESVTWYGFAREIAAARRPEVEVVPVTTDEFPRPARRPAYSVLDVERFESLVGRRVEPWTAGLSDYLAHPDGAAAGC